MNAHPLVPIRQIGDFLSLQIEIVHDTVHLHWDHRLTSALGESSGFARSRISQAEGYLIIGSGGTVHNLRALDWDAASVESWAAEFDARVGERLRSWSLEELFAYEKWAPHAKRAVPRNEHFIPLLIAMGAGDDRRNAECLHQTYRYGMLSLSCWQFARTPGAGMLSS